MRIEKISDTQIKFILTKEDFKERNLSISELTYNSEKTQTLFREMMERAAFETGFEVDQCPLVIEAMPLVDSLMVIVSKVSDKNDGEYSSPLSNLFGRLSGMAGVSGNAAKEMEQGFNSDNSLEFRSFQNSHDSKRIKLPKNMAIYSFDSLDDVSLASARLQPLFKGASSLYKYDGKYFICIQLPFKTAVLKMGDLENVLCEYGQKHISNTVSRGFLLEHGETIINSNAVNKLASI